MCSFYLDLERPRWFREGRPGAVFPWCMVRARGSFRQPQTFNIHSARLAARRTAGSSKGPSSWPFPLLPGLESGSALKRRSTISLLVVFKTIGLSEITLQRPMAEVENARRSGHEIVDCFPRSGGYRDRTGDIQLAKLALSQLS